MQSAQTYYITVGDSVVDSVFGQFTTLDADIIPPNYLPRANFVDAVVNVDLSTNWSGVGLDPNGYTVDQLPLNLSMNAQGVVTGTATPSGQNVAVTVSNSGIPAESFQWRVIERPDISGGSKPLSLNLKLRI